LRQGRWPAAARRQPSRRVLPGQGEPTVAGAALRPGANAKTPTNAVRRFQTPRGSAPQSRWSSIAVCRASSSTPPQIGRSAIARCDWQSAWLVLPGRLMARDRRHVGWGAGHARAPGVQRSQETAEPGAPAVERNREPGAVGAAFNAATLQLGLCLVTCGCARSPPRFDEVTAVDQTNTDRRE